MFSYSLSSIIDHISCDQDKRTFLPGCLMLTSGLQCITYSINCGVVLKCYRITFSINLPFTTAHILQKFHVNLMDKSCLLMLILTDPSEEQQQQRHSQTENSSLSVIEWINFTTYLVHRNRPCSCESSPRICPSSIGEHLSKRFACSLSWKEALHNSMHSRTVDCPADSKRSSIEKQ